MFGTDTIGTTETEGRKLGLRVTHLVGPRQMCNLYRTPEGWEHNSLGCVLPTVDVEPVRSSSLNDYSTLSENLSRLDSMEGWES